MAIDPEVIPASSMDGTDSVSLTPRWLLYLSLGLGVLILFVFLRCFSH